MALSREEDIKALKDALKELDAVLDEKLGNDAPLLRPLVQLVERLPVKVSAQPEPETSQEQSETQTPEQSSSAQKSQAGEASGSSSAASSSSISVSQSDTLESPKDVNRLLGQCVSSLSHIVQFYMQNDLANPMLYQINRFCAWVDVDMLPVVQEGNKTMIPPPDETVKTTIQGLIASREYEDAVRACEARVKEFIFWLDLSYWSAQALQELGGKYIKAYEAVAFSTAGYVQRLPGLEGLAFSDGTPFVSPETKAWLKGLKGGDEASIDASEKDSLLAELDKKARELLQKKKIAEAVAVWQQGMETSTGLRQKFQCRIFSSSCCWQREKKRWLFHMFLCFWMFWKSIN